MEFRFCINYLEIEIKALNINLFAEPMFHKM